MIFVVDHHCTCFFFRFADTSMCIVGEKKFVLKGVSRSVTGALDGIEKFDSLSGEEFEVKQQKWYVCFLFLVSLAFRNWFFACIFSNVDLNF